MIGRWGMGSQWALFPALGSYCSFFLGIGWGPFLESPETSRVHFGWHNSLCIFKTKAPRGTRQHMKRPVLRNIKAGRSFTNGFRETGPWLHSSVWFSLVLCRLRCYYCSSYPSSCFFPFRVVLAKVGMLGHLLEELNIHNWLTDLLSIMNPIHNREQIIWYDFSQQWLDGL